MSNWYRSEARPAAGVGLCLGFVLGLCYAGSLMRGSYDPWLITRRAIAAYPLMEAAWWGIVFLVLSAIIGLARWATDRVTSRGIAVPAVLPYGALAVLLAAVLLGLRTQIVDALTSLLPGGRTGAGVLALVGVVLLTRLRPADRVARGPASRRSRIPLLTALAASVVTTGLAAMTVPARTAKRRAATDTRPNVVLITVDALRFDALGDASLDAPFTPHEDALMERGVVFSHAFAQAPWTVPSVTALMTSRYPSEAGVAVLHGDPAANYLRVSGSTPTLADALRAVGYRTAAQVTNTYLARSLMFDRGFSQYRHSNSRHDLAPFCYRAILRLWPGLRARAMGSAQNARANDADKVTLGAATWLRDEREEPFFLWLHYLDPHRPYAPPDAPDMSVDEYQSARAMTRETGPSAAAARRRLRDLYRAEVTYCDRWIGEFIRVLDESGLTERTMIVLTADHGEAFWEHGKQGHGSLISDEMLRVPLVIVFPDGRGAGTTIDRPVRLLDIMPTVLECAGVARPDSLRGASLMSLVDGSPEGGEGRRELYAECTLVPPERKGLRTDSDWLVHAPAQGSFTWVPETPFRNREAEPERANRTGAEPRLRAWTEEMASALQAADRRSPRFSPGEREQLRALGYL